MCDMPGIHECTKECFKSCEVPENKEETTNQEATVSDLSVSKVLDEGKEIICGAGIGLAYGVTVSTICVASGVLKIATYPVYMARCAVQPIFDVATPLWFPVFTTFLGAATGLGVKLADK